MFNTDFELPVMEDESDLDDGSSEITGLDVDSDEFEVALDDETTGDEVELIEDEGDDVLVVDEDDMVPAARRGRASLDDEFDEVDDTSSASKALSDVGGRRAASAYDDEAVVAAPAAWGPLPAIVLLLTLPLMFLGTLMSYEVVKGMFGYQNATSPGTALGARRGDGRAG